MGAWIEINYHWSDCYCKNVAPHMGAWIEIDLAACPGRKAMSHPTWVRGLKLVTREQYEAIKVSHPTWVRGLKLSKESKCQRALVAPHMGAWIEILSNDVRDKLNVVSCRTPHGCVD